MIHCPTVTKSSIRFHYDLGTLFYRLLWGEHIHHGLWEDGSETPERAQQQLIERMAGLARLQPADAVLDVGCGMGGSTIEMARTYDCKVTGVTLSPVQRMWANWSAEWRGVGNRVRFRCQDAETLDFPPETFDVIWSIECTEHLFDKASFFQKAAGWLRPGGRLVICAWLAVDDATPEADAEALKVAEAFLCPSFGTPGDYQRWFAEAGLENRSYDDLTERVAETWDICQRRVEITGVGRLGWLAGRQMKAFLDHFQTLGNAYRSGAMRYGMFLAEKPR